MTNKKRARPVRLDKYTIERWELKSDEGRIPPDPDGYFAMQAVRAAPALAIFQMLAEGIERNELVRFLLVGLMHLCDRDEQLGEVADAYEWAVDMYEATVAESRHMAALGLTG